MCIGWLILIASSFATTSVSDILGTQLALPMGQLFLDVLGKNGMLAIWSFIIVVQASIKGYIVTYNVTETPHFLISL